MRQREGERIEREERKKEKGRTKARQRGGHIKEK